MELATTGVTSSVLDDPRGRELLPEGVSGEEELRASDRRSGGHTGESGDERRLLIAETHTIETPNDANGNGECRRRNLRQRQHYTKP
jgi:hypothetical protein